MATSHKLGLVLDVDGVVVREKALLRRIGHNCSKFVQATSTRPISIDEATKLNNQYYKAYGHTLRALNEIKKPSYKSKLDLEHMFIETVYDKSTLSQLSEYLSGPIFIDNMSGFNQVAMICKENNIPLYLFSNAPDVWCGKVAEKLQTMYGVYIDDVFSGNTMNMLIKPDITAYDHVKQNIRNSSDVNKVLFVDDSLINLLPVKRDPFWIPLWFKPEDMREIRDDVRMEQFGGYNSLAGIGHILDMKYLAYYITDKLA
jgi:FMN phosphatase YigB (HAD superfamily)